MYIYVFELKKNCMRSAIHKAYEFNVSKFEINIMLILYFQLYLKALTANEIMFMLEVKVS